MLAVGVLVWVLLGISKTLTQQVLQSTAFKAALIGENATLHCSMGAGSAMNSYTMSWYRQVYYGAPMEFIMKEYEKSTAKFSVALVTDKNTFSLLISDLAVQDGLSSGVNIVQEPKVLFANLDSSVTLHCKHDDTDHYRMAWYRQAGGKRDLELLAFSMGQNSAGIEPPFDKTNKYAMTRPEVTKGTLQIEKIEATDSAVYFCASKSLSGILITQTPSLLFKERGESVKLGCEHNDSTYYYIYWYRQRSMGELDLIAMSVGKGTVQIVPPFSDSKYSMTRPEVKNSVLQIEVLQSEDSAAYFCASSTPQCLSGAIQLNNNLTRGLSDG
ncbi:hypothetical protein NFI96_000500 [Prochilodus magdalenae]|nr:hypothetical protein NFI96_000500 [Prochilodus magdalenae]